MVPRFPVVVLMAQRRIAVFMQYRVVLPPGINYRAFFAIAIVPRGSGAISHLEQARRPANGYVSR
jgi:hypothetical protein